MRIKLKHMEVEIRKRETTGAGTAAHSETETLAKYEIMDGAPVSTQRGLGGVEWSVWQDQGRHRRGWGLVWITCQGSLAKYEVMVGASVSTKRGGACWDHLQGKVWGLTCGKCQGKASVVARLDNL